LSSKIFPNNIVEHTWAQKCRIQDIERITAILARKSRFKAAFFWTGYNIGKGSAFLLLAHTDEIPSNGARDKEARFWPAP
jgi:hypothetical protein